MRQIHLTLNQQNCLKFSTWERQHILFLPFNELEERVHREGRILHWYEADLLPKERTEDKFQDGSTILLGNKLCI